MDLIRTGSEDTGIAQGRGAVPLVVGSESQGVEAEGWSGERGERLWWWMWIMVMGWCGEDLELGLEVGRVEL